MVKKFFSFKMNTILKYHRGGKIDIQQLASKLPGFPWAKYAGEKHFLNHNFTGPGTNLQERLNADDTPKENSKPVNRVDEAAYKHDLAYRDSEDLTIRHEADRKMIYDMENIKNPTFREKLDRLIILPIIKAKVKLGVGFTDEELAKEIHKEFRKPKLLRKVKVFNKDDIWTADLVHMPAELGYKYILTVMDIYTRYAWCKPLKSKRAQEVKSAFEEIIKKSKRKPVKLWVDEGKEFNFIKSLGIEVYNTHNFGKAVMIERFNRTITNKLWKQFSINGNQKWIKILQSKVDDYNNSVHRSIDETPVKASTNPNIVKEVNNKNNYENENNEKISTKSKYKIDDRVRIFKYKNKFEKGYKGYWTNEIFKIYKILKTSPITYKIKDLDDEEIIGSFYESELQKTVF